MTIETKYNRGDRVWYMRSNHPVPGIIKEIKIEIGYEALNHNKERITIQYFGNWEGTQWGFAEFDHSVFPTKEALLQSL